MLRPGAYLQSSLRDSSTPCDTYPSTEELGYYRAPLRGEVVNQMTLSVPAIYPVGIDLGTTQSAAAVIDEQGASQMICDARGEMLTPSVALFKGDEIVVGRDAERGRRSAPNDIAEMAKRDMGQSRFRHAVKGRFLPPEVIQAYILRKLRGDIVTALGEDYRVVISVPAYFDEPRRKATADAGMMSGLEMLDIVNEPTAAALAFGERLGYLDIHGAPRNALTLLVYDLGGGTFDVTIVRLEPDGATTLATDGDAQLGGYDWDMRLVEQVIDHCQRTRSAGTRPRSCGPRPTAPTCRSTPNTACR